MKQIFDWKMFNQNTMVNKSNTLPIDLSWLTTNMSFVNCNESQWLFCFTGRFITDCSITCPPSPEELWLTAEQLDPQQTTKEAK